MMQAPQAAPQFPQRPSIPSVGQATATGDYYHPNMADFGSDPLSREGQIAQQQLALAQQNRAAMSPNRGQAEYAPRPVQEGPPPNQGFWWNNPNMLSKPLSPEAISRQKANAGDMEGKRKAYTERRAKAKGDDAFARALGAGQKYGPGAYLASLQRGNQIGPEGMSDQQLMPLGVNMPAMKLQADMERQKAAAQLATAMMMREGGAMAPRQWAELMGAITGRPVAQNGGPNVPPLTETTKEGGKVKNVAKAIDRVRTLGLDPGQAQRALLDEGYTPEEIDRELASGIGEWWGETYAAHPYLNFLDLIGRGQANLNPERRARREWWDEEKAAKRRK